MENQQTYTPMKTNVFLRIAALIFCLLLCSIAYLSGMYGRYSTRAETLEKARVAKFSVTAQQSNNEEVNALALSTTNPEEKYYFNISSESEVTVTFDILVKFGVALPEGINVTIDGNTEIPFTIEENGTVYRFQNFKVMMPGNQVSEEHFIQFNLDRYVYSNAENVVITDILIGADIWQVD